MDSYIYIYLHINIGVRVKDSYKHRDQKVQNIRQLQYITRKIQVIKQKSGKWGSLQNWPKNHVLALKGKEHPKFFFRDFQVCESS